MGKIYGSDVVGGVSNLFIPKSCTSHSFIFTCSFLFES
jgi:hypothetical protein